MVARVGTWRFLTTYKSPNTGVVFKKNRGGIHLTKFAEMTKLILRTLWQGSAITWQTFATLWQVLATRDQGSRPGIGVPSNASRVAASSA